MPGSDQPPSAPLAAALAAVPLLAGLPAQLIAQLAAEARTIRVAAGDYLFREDDPAQSLFVTRYGRLEVVAGGPPPVVIRVLKRGSVLGELALLGEGTRSASVYARRNSELIELRREHFDELIRGAPEFAVGLTRSIARQLAASRAPAPPAEAPRTFAVVALGAGARAREVCELLASALRKHGSVAHLRPDDGEPAADRAALLDRAERDHDRVLLDGGDEPGGDGWGQFCRDEADLIIAVSTGAPDASRLERPAELQGCELLVVGTGVSEAALALIAPREAQVIAHDRLPCAVEALARRLTGCAIGLVLSGGGARAFAHLGVYEELHDAGVHVDRLGGASMGGLVAGFIAMGAAPDDIRDIFERCFVRQNPTNDYTLPLFSLIRGRKTQRMLAEEFGERRIEQLPRRFYCVSCDLVGRQVVLHRTGRVRDAVYASLAIPGIYPPHRDGAGRLLVDGGVLDNLPVETMARTGAGPVIAVDVGQRDTASPPARRRRLGPAGRALVGTDVQLPPIGETLLRTLTLGSADTVAAALRHADLVITPRVEGVGMLEWKRLDSVREIGRQAARAALDAQTAGARVLS